MEEKRPTVEQILRMMAENPGEEPRPMVLMSKVLPEWIPKQAQERKHLIMIGVAAAVSSRLCTETFIKIAKRAGAKITKGEV